MGTKKHQEKDHRPLLTDDEIENWGDPGFPFCKKTEECDLARGHKGPCVKPYREEDEISDRWYPRG